MIEAGYTLTQLASEYGCTTGNLRQRIARGTLTAIKVGPLWVVPFDEVQRFLTVARHSSLSRRDRGKGLP
jgi:hypothetical protein